MKERPIIFSGPIINAILAGRKTQTRRVIKCNCNCLHNGKLLGEWGLSKPPYRWTGAKDDALWQLFGESPVVGDWVEWFQTDVDDYASEKVPCPYGKPGDRLWVRESWLKLDRDHRHDVSKPNDWLAPWGDKPRRNGCAYKADATSESERCRLELGYKNWTPSIHMPRWASRITLEVTNVRVERLLSITEDDAISEGATLADNPDYDPDDPFDDAPQSYRAGFLESWGKINAKRGFAYDMNPWVWVLEFKRVEA